MFAHSAAAAAAVSRSNVESSSTSSSGEPAAIPSHYVIVPILNASAYASASPVDFNIELKEVTQSAGHDIAFLKSSKENVADTIYYTGDTNNADGKSNTKNLTQLFDTLSTTTPSAPITIHISAHGSPGKEGCVGIGFDDSKHFNFRLKPQELLTQLETCGFNQLKDHPIHFIFRTCNSGYTTFNLFKKDPVAMEEAIKQNSFIGEFFSLLQTNGYLGTSVTGVRGYYMHGKKQIVVGHDKNTVNFDDGKITLHHDGSITFGKRITYIKNISTLDEKINPSSNQTPKIRHPGH